MDKKRKRSTRSLSTIRSFVRRNINDEEQEEWSFDPHNNYYYVDEEDAVAFWTIIVETGIMSIDCFREDSDFKEGLLENCGWYNDNSTTNNQRIMRVELDTDGKFPHNFSTVRLFGALGTRLKGLEEIDLENWAPFPLIDALMCFPGLKRLEIGKCDRVVMDFGYPPVMEGKTLELEQLDLRGDEIDEEELEFFLFEILPVLPKLTEFHVHIFRTWNTLSFQKIANRIRKEFQDQPISSRLRKLCIYDRIYDEENRGHEYRERLQSDPSELEALKTVLWAFPELHDIHCFNDYANPIIQHILNINKVGRVLVMGKKGSNQIPLSVWPTVLKRAWKIAAKPLETPGSWGWNWRAPDAIYYLIRNAPALQGMSQRRGQKSDSGNCNVSSIVGLADWHFRKSILSSLIAPKHTVRAAVLRNNSA